VPGQVQQRRRALRRQKGRVESSSFESPYRAGTGVIQPCRSKLCQLTSLGANHLSQVGSEISNPKKSGPPAATFHGKPPQIIRNGLSLPSTVCSQAISIITSSPSIFTGKTSTFARSGGSATPVSVSNVHECHGHTTALPSIQPCPSGPRLCGHQLSSAESFPPTFARHTATPFASASLTSPDAGASLAAHNRTHCATLSPSTRNFNDFNST
jgi:hypothetical protein